MAKENAFHRRHRGGAGEVNFREILISLNILRKTTSFMQKSLDIFRKATSFMKKSLDIFRKTTSTCKVCVIVSLKL